MENDTSVLFNDECEQLNNSDLQIQEIKSLADVTLNNQSEAMLTQKMKMIVITSSILYIPYMKKKPNKIATALYQMLKIQD